jgi:hypothetical protein
MEHLKLLNLTIKLFKNYGFEFEYEKNWKGILKHFFYVGYIISAILMMTMIMYFTLYGAKNSSEVIDGVSKFIAMLFPVFRSITFYLQRKTAIKIFELMKEISIDCK